jgi:hypothetical protein
MATFTQLTNRVQNMAMEADAAEAGAFINDVYKDIVINTQSKPTSTTFTLTAGDTSVPITTNDSVVIMYVLYTSVGDTLNQVLEPTTFEEILNLNSSQPTGFIRKYTIIGTGANTKLQIYPTCQQTGDTLTIWIAAEPTVLSGGVDIPVSLPSQWHYLISLGAATRLIQAVGEDDNLASSYEQKYDAGMLKFKQWLGRRQGNVTTRMLSGYSRNQQILPHRNDRDTRWSY